MGSALDSGHLSVLFTSALQPLPSSHSCPYKAWYRRGGAPVTSRLKRVKMGMEQVRGWF